MRACSPRAPPRAFGTCPTRALGAASWASRPVQLARSTFAGRALTLVLVLPSAAAQGAREPLGASQRARSGGRRGRAVLFAWCLVAPAGISRSSRRFGRDEHRGNRRPAGLEGFAWRRLGGRCFQAGRGFAADARVVEVIRDVVIGGDERLACQEEDVV